MSNNSNLRPIELTHEEATILGAKGGKASAKARREKKAMRETLNTLLTMPLQKGQVNELDEIISLGDLKGANLTVQDAIMLSQVRKAIKGDLRSAEFIRDTVGEKPKDTIEINKDVDETALAISEYIDDYKKRNSGTDSE